MAILLKTLQCTPPRACISSRHSPPSFQQTLAFKFAPPVSSDSLSTACSLPLKQLLRVSHPRVSLRGRSVGWRMKPRKLLARALSDGSGEEGRRFTVTTPLYYVNAAPHMGSAYPTIAADALARFQRLRGRDVVFITGTDEHGEKIALAAAAKDRAPKEHCDVVAAEYQSLWKDLGIAYDKFIRTTDANHEKIVAEFYKRVEDKGDIYQATYEGLYCVNCEEYKFGDTPKLIGRITWESAAGQDEKELIEGHCCPVHRKPCDPRKEENYFFALSKYQQPLEELLMSNPDFVRPSFRMNEVQGWVKEGLRDFSISRAAVEWGIPVPGDPKQTIYVWFDALLGYMSALLAEGKEPNLANATERGWPASVHIIGKDILRFHAVYWPAMLMSAGFQLPESVYGHGFLTKDGLKMGKSLGNTIEPKDLVSRFGPDAVRYYFLKEIEFGKDGDFSEKRFIDIVNANLANTIGESIPKLKFILLYLHMEVWPTVTWRCMEPGNLLNRTLGLLKKNCDATVPFDSSSLPEDNSVRVLATEAVEKARIEFSELQYSMACDDILAIANAGNVYMNDRVPWALFKQGGCAAEEASQTLTIILEAVRIVAVALSPVIPEFCRRIYLQLGYTDAVFKSLSWEDTRWGGLRAGQVMADAKPIFQKLEEEEVSEGISGSARTGGKKKDGGKVKQKLAPIVAKASASQVL